MMSKAREQSTLLESMVNKKRTFNEASNGEEGGDDGPIENILYNDSTVSSLKERISFLESEKV